MIREIKNTDLVNYLVNKGILATGLNFPLVPKDDKEMRFQVNAGHTLYDFDYTLSILKEHKKDK